MGYLIKAPLGLGLFFGGIILFNVKLISLLETGTCASGNTPYQISQPCPAGTGTDILLLIAGIFGGLIGAAIFAFRGDPPWDRDGRGRRFGSFSFGVFAWGFFFAATGATSLIASLTNQAIQDSSGGKLGGIIVGGTFLVMGVPALLIALAGLLRGLRGRDERPPAMTATASGIGGGGVMSRMSAGLDQARAAQELSGRVPWGSTPPSGGGGTSGQIAKLERLQKLRESGALTETEFEREKAKVLAEG
jgi:putative oligomerization/nucleic acid binding protein